MTPSAAMNQELILPPVYRPIACGMGDALSRATAEAKAGAGAGTLVWSQRLDRFDAAVVFEPEMPLAKARLALYAAMLSVADALGALGPPNKPITFTWPDRIHVDAGFVGGVRLVEPAGTAGTDTPDWLVAGVVLRMENPAWNDNPGKDPDRTALYEEGFGEVAVPALVESVSRHLLNWTSRWLDEGPDPMLMDWLNHLPPDRRTGDVKHGLDPATGDLLLLHPGRTKPESRSLAGALAQPAWKL